MAYDYKNIGKSPSSPGIASTIYIIPVSEIATFGVLNSGNSTAQGASVIVDTDHVPVVLGKSNKRTWRTQKFVDIIEDFTHTIIDRDVVVQTLIDEGYSYTYIKHIGIEWYVIVND